MREYFISIWMIVWKDILLELRTKQALAQGTVYFNEGSQTIFNHNFFN